MHSLVCIDVFYVVWKVRIIWRLFKYDNIYGYIPWGETVMVLELTTVPVASAARQT
jgi:hypothetical protein